MCHIKYVYTVMYNDWRSCLIIFWFFNLSCFLPMQTNYHGGNKAMVIHVVHHIGIISTCLACWFSFYIFKHAYAYGFQWSAPDTGQCTSFEHVMDEKNKTERACANALKDQLICKNNAPNKKLLSYQNFKHLCPLQIIVMYTFWFPII